MARSGRHRLTGARRTPAGRLLLAAAVLLASLAVPAAVAAGLTLAHGGLAGGLVGSPMAAERIDTGGTGLDIRRVPESGQGRHAAAEEQLVASVVADLEVFWSATVPAIAHQQFAPLRGGVTAVDSAAPAGNAPCVASPGQINGNAYYCPADDGIVYDSSALVPVLLNRYGAPGLVGAFAHEFGHVVQARIGPTADQRTADPRRYPSLLVEAQGDCDAGAFLAWVVAGKAPHLHLDTSGMAAAIGPLVGFADPVTVSRSDPAAHGLALDRLSSVLLGYRGGAATCVAMTVDSLHPTLGEVPLPAGGVTALGTPRYGSHAAVQAAARASIAAFAGRSVSGLDLDPAVLAAVAPYGQFAEATALAVAAGRTLRPDGDPTCFAGAWVASVFGHAPAGTLGSWPGDADEGLAAVRHLPGATFADAAGYADGFHDGVGACG